MEVFNNSQFNNYTWIVLLDASNTSIITTPLF